MTKIIFFGNGPLADYSKAILEKNCEIVFHARTKEDLTEVKRLKSADSSLHGVLASFGVMIKSDVLDLFEPEGILNIHPSLLPNYRGSSPIETAILNGDKDFSYSIMKLVKAMDAGPTFHQATLNFPENVEKNEIYETLAESAANWLVKNIEQLPTPVEQTGEPTFTVKFDKSMSALKPQEKSAETLLNEVRAFKGFPKSKYTFFDLDCIIQKAHVSDIEETKLSLKCSDNRYLIIDEIQPAGRKTMDAKSFLNGYAK